MNINTMDAIQAEKRKQAEAERLPLNPEGKALAEHKKNSFDYPVNAVKVDPLR